MKRFAIDTLVFDRTHLEIRLANGRVLRQPLHVHHPLAEASTEQRHHWQRIDEDTRIVWPRLSSNGAPLVIDIFDWLWEDDCERALAELERHAWELDALEPHSRDTVVLWRLLADGYNGGFLQFFCNWGEGTCQLALEALQAIGARATHAIVERQRRLLDPLQDHPDMHDMLDLYRLLSDEDMQTLSVTLDSAFWEAAREVPRLAVRHPAGPVDA